MIYFYFFLFQIDTMSTVNSAFQIFSTKVFLLVSKYVEFPFFVAHSRSLALLSEILNLELFGMCQREFSFFFSLVLRTIAHRCEFNRIISVGNSHRFILLYISLDISHRWDKMKLDFAWTCNVNTELTRTYEAFLLILLPNEIFL